MGTSKKIEMLNRLISLKGDCYVPGKGLTCIECALLTPGSGTIGGTCSVTGLGKSKERLKLAITTLAKIRNKELKFAEEHKLVKRLLEKI